MIEGAHVAFFPDDVKTATLLLAALLSRSDNVDIGLMQINYKYHVKGTNIDPVSLLQPDMNVSLGCRILGEAMAASATLWEGIGRYHSYTPSRLRSYAIRVLQTASKGLPHD